MRVTHIPFLALTFACCASLLSLGAMVTVGVITAAGGP